MPSTTRADVAVAARVADLDRDERDVRRDTDDAEAVAPRGDRAGHVRAVELVVDAWVRSADAGAVGRNVTESLPRAQSTFEPSPLTRSRGGCRRCRCRERRRRPPASRTGRRVSVAVRMCCMCHCILYRGFDATISQLDRVCARSRRAELLSCAQLVAASPPASAPASAPPLWAGLRQTCSWSRQRLAVAAARASRLVRRRPPEIDRSSTARRAVADAASASVPGARASTRPGAVSGSRPARRGRRVAGRQLPGVARGGSRARVASRGVVLPR